MGLKVSLPRIFHSGLESDHQHTLSPEFLGKLISSEGFAEAHFRVPEEARDGVHVLFPDRVEIVVSFAHGFVLLGAHHKGLIVPASESAPGTQLSEDSFHVLERTAHPLQFGVLATLPGEGGAHFMICEGCAVVALGELIENDGVILDVGGLELLGDALLHVARGLPHLEQTSVRLIFDGIGVNARPGLRLRRKYPFYGWLTHRRRC